MSVYDGLFMRDALEDNGTVPSPGFYYMSPDIICHSQVADPQTFFINNYNSDPNQPVELGSAINFIYARAKNLSDSSLSGYIHVYRSSSSLFMTPGIWKNNALQTLAGASYLTLNNVASGQIAVGNDHFVMEAVKSNLFCMVGIASTEINPVIPDDFSSYSDFILWVRQNQNVCVRNFSLTNNYPDRNYERLDSFSNPENKDVPAMFKVTATNLPAGTIFGIQCAPLNIDKSQNVNDGTILTDSGMCPANFEGTVTTYATLPSGISQWPDNARLEVEVYIGLDLNTPAAIYAEPWDNLPLKRHEIPYLQSNGILVRLGYCGTEFINS